MPSFNYIYDFTNENVVALSKIYDFEGKRDRSL